MESNSDYYNDIEEFQEETCEKGKEFNVNKIKKYFKNQSYPTDLSIPYTDDIFPPNENSLLALNQNKKPICKASYEENRKDIDTENTEWKRVSEVIPDFLLFEDEIEFNDIKQGNLGNCYFLSALATLSDYPNLIYKIFKTKEESPIGFYEIAFFLDGEWNIVIIDDYIPVQKDSDSFAFAQPNGKEVWVLLIEKAWAKINGGYLNTISGYPTDPFTALTGFSKKHYYLESLKLDEVWKILKDSYCKNYFIACSTNQNKSNENFGIVSTHAYTLLSAKESNYEGKDLRLIKLRNPHGCTEFNGDWSDTSPLWNEKLNKIFDHKISSEDDYNDGLFFISLEDFVKFFDSLYICFPIYNSQVKSFLIGENTELALNQPHIFSLNIPKNSEVSLLAHAPFWRYNRKLVNKNHPINILIAKFNKEENSLEFCDGDFSAVTDPVIRKNLKPGNYFIWVYCGLNEENKRNIKNYRFKICADSRFTCNYEKIDENFIIFKEIVLSGIEAENKEQIDEEKSVEVIGELKTTEINYCYVYNNSGGLWKYAMNWNASNASNFSILKPYENKENFEMYIPNKEKRFFFALKKVNDYVDFEVEYETSNAEDEEYIEEKDSDEKVNLEDYITYENLDFTPEDEYYDYICPSKEESKKKIDFSNKKVQEFSKEECIEEYPSIMNKFFEYFNFNNENEENENEENSEEELNLENGQKKILTEGGTYIGYTDEYDNFQGQGVYIFDNGSYLLGNFLDNMLNGEGEEYDENGELIYQGKYKMGERSGKGILNYSDGSVYEGKLKNSSRNGKGTYKDADGDTFTGIWVDDKKHGKGIFHWSTGQCWEGKFKNDIFHGKGTYWDNEGNSSMVTYRDGEQVEE